MADDYRVTEYCQPIEDLKNKKANVEALVKKDYPEAIDMHTYISRNEGPYKVEFIKAYSGKCAYCGASIRFVPKTLFQIDHFIYQKDPRFHNRKANAGYIDNLVLACNICNSAKKAFAIPDEVHNDLHPDLPGITKTFIRDDDFYIRVSPEKKGDTIVNKFYEQVKLGEQVHRLDYLLLSMYGLREKIGDTSPAYGQLSRAIDLIHQKRNLLG